MPAQVTVYQKTPKGVVEVRMFEIDAVEAVNTHPTEWSFEKPVEKPAEEIPALPALPGKGR